MSGGSKLTKITDGAVSFDSSGDYLTIGDSSDFEFGTGDFTIECFIYPKGNVNYRYIIDCRDQVSDPGGWILGVNVFNRRLTLHLYKWFSLKLLIQIQSASKTNGIMLHM